MLEKRKVMVVVIAMFLIFMIGNSLGYQVLAEEEDEVICKGIYIDSISIGDMTVENAKETIENYISEIQNTTVQITVAEDVIETTLGELGYDVQAYTYIEDALNFGKTGNLIKRYKELKDVEHQPVVYELTFEIDKDKVKKFVKKNTKKYETKPVNSELVRKNNKFIATDHKVGTKVSVEDTTSKIVSYIENDWNHQDGGDILVDAVVTETQPKYTKEMVAKCQDVLGEFSTTYTSSSASRANNLANGAKLINGSIVYPGEVFSASEKMSPITEANGYSNAGAYANGKVIDSIGGGVCQVSTTLYNAILKAELEIVERYNHSMIVGYVEPAMDAAISEGYKDLKFKNNTNAPIYVEAYTEGRKITFVLYGEETRDLKNRKVKYVSEVIERIQPGADIVTEDNTKDPSYFKVEQSAHIGYKANLWKVVTENGVEVSREKVNYSSYAAEPRHVIKGTKGVKKTPEPSESPKESESPEPSEKATEEPEDIEASTKPEKTKKPGTTEDPETTEGPETTKKPKKTAKPEATEKPETTKKPKATKKPEATKKPADTPKPTNTPKPTAEPVIEPTPEPVNEPEIEVTAEPETPPMEEELEE